MKVFITKYALTQGILEREAEKATENETITVVERENKYSFMTYYRKNEWFDNLTDASLHAEEMRKKKIESVKKQLAKLEKMKFIED